MNGQINYTLSDFPPYPDETDDTGRFKRAIEAMLPGGVLHVPAGQYLVKEIAVTKPISLWFAEGAILEATDETTAFLFQFAGDVSASGYPLLREVVRGERTLILPQAPCDIQAGDLIWLRDDCARVSDGQQDLNCEMHEVVDVIYEEQELLAEAKFKGEADRWIKWGERVSPGLSVEHSYDQVEQAQKLHLRSASLTGEAMVCSNPVPVEAGRTYQLEVSAKVEWPSHEGRGCCYVAWEGKKGEPIARSDVISFSYQGWQIYYGCNLIAPSGASKARIFIGLQAAQTAVEGTVWVKNAAFKQTSTKLVLKDFVRLPKRVARVNVRKITPLQFCQVINFRYRLKQGAHKGFGILAQQVRYFYVNGLYAEQGVESAIQVRRSMDVIIENFTIMPPQRVGSGQGYGVQFYGGNLGVIVRNGCTWRTRHAVDLDSTFDALVEGVTDVEGKGVSFLLTHNGWGGDMVFRHCRAIRSGSSGFVAETQGVTNPYTLMHPNIHIVDCYWQRASSEGDVVCYGFGIWLKAPVSGRVERFTAQVGTGQGYVKGHDNGAIRLLPVRNQLRVHHLVARGVRRGIIIAHPHEVSETGAHHYIFVSQVCLEHCRSAVYVNGGWGKRLFMSDMLLDRIEKYVIEGNGTGGYQTFVMERVSITRSPSVRFFQHVSSPRTGSAFRGWIRKIWRDWVSRGKKR
ncbi:right-handed parallel beta-helix repeat-containing protein [Laceyella putida]|uniref:Pectate lyase superfamily protein domain-containing protein n=1 Tax=Laceyella putida TaxID=110101 RepID=A0ABW2RQQ6_9BACL